mgnify:CR=1 FL=1
MRIPVRDSAIIMAEIIVQIMMHIQIIVLNLPLIALLFFVMSFHMRLKLLLLKR